MVFGKKKSTEEPASSTTPHSQPPSQTQILLLASSAVIADQNFIHQAQVAIAPQPLLSKNFEQLSPDDLRSIRAVVLVDAPTELSKQVLRATKQLRGDSQNGLPVVIIATPLSHLLTLGELLISTASDQTLDGVRLIAYNELSQIPEQLSFRLSPITEPSVLRMPAAPELENSPIKNFYAISPQLKQVVKKIRELAENNVTRVYMLGGPGTGKTSISYYYWLVRKKGKFVAVNLNAESTDDKGAMKSLLCGHVTGAFPGAAGREGALSHAAEGVCFLDESHGVTGVVMQVLMEVLDSGQFLPFGGTAKRPLECAVLFASNRSWETLRSSIALDEHARLGATVIDIPPLKDRPEDIIAVLATTLANFKNSWTTWAAPEGLTPEAWNAIENCAWNGNIRTLIRVLETAAVSHAAKQLDAALLSREEISEGINLWEPTEHESLKLYAATN